LKNIALVLEELPVEGLNGQCTYNNSFIQALIHLGYSIDLYIVGPRPCAAELRKKFKLNFKQCTVHYYHFFCVGDAVFPRSIMGTLRWIYQKVKSSYLIDTIVKKLRGRGRESNNVYIAREISLDESNWVVQQVLKKKTDCLLFDTIFRFDENLQSLGLKKIIIGHDVFYARSQSLLSSGLSPVPNVDIKFEVERLNLADGVITITQVEELKLKQVGVSSSLLTLYSPMQLNIQTHESVDTKSILFIGSRGSMNVEGMKWFINAVWPLIINEVPNAKLEVCGNVCSELINVPENIRLHGRVDSVAPIASNCMFAINPVLAGSGLKIKMVDYFSLGLACITTSSGAEGFPEDINRPIAVCDSAETYASMCIAWLKQPELQVKHTEQARLYSEHFMPQHFAEKLNHFINEVANA